MKLPESFSIVRARYIALLRERVTSRREADPRVVAEALIIFHPPPDQPPIPGTFNLSRADVLYRDEEGREKVKLFHEDAAIIAADPATADHPVLEHRSGMTVQVRPFSWGWCEFLLTSGPDGLGDTSALEQWQQERVDLAQSRTPGEDGLLGVVHGVVPPRKLALRRYHATIDFGSAPLEAMEEALDQFAAMGVKRLQLFR